MSPPRIQDFPARRDFRRLGRIGENRGGMDVLALEREGIENLERERLEWGSRNLPLSIMSLISCLLPVSRISQPGGTRRSCPDQSNGWER